MTCSLVDAEDYPRGDIDLYKVRTARQRINCLQNDLNSLIKEINSGLEAHFAEMKVSGEEQEPREERPKPIADSQGTSEKNGSTKITNKEPFAIITDITSGSPAQDAGLRIKDEIIEFGSLHGENYEALKQFADIAEHKLNKQVAVLVKRKETETSFETIQLVPRKWSGRGYLGMMVKPL